jgi:hypothetical protein
MRVIIAGSRDFNDYELLKSNVYNILKDETMKNNSMNFGSFEIVCGKARGADTLGEKFGKEFGLTIKYFIPDWNGLGKSAGYVRNSDMAKYAKVNNGVLIAFWDGESKGTKHMIDLANKYGLKQEDIA